MERFTYTRTGQALKNRLFGLMLLAAVDLVSWVIPVAVLPKPWGPLIGLGGLAVTGLVYWFVAAPLRTAHVLDGERLLLQMGRHRLALRREDICGAAPWKAPLPRGVEASGISYRTDTDTLYVLADRRRLVALTLARPYETKVPDRGLCQFTRVVLSLDEPDRFCAALAAPQVPGREPREPTPVPSATAAAVPSATAPEARESSGYRTSGPSPGVSTTEDPSTPPEAPPVTAGPNPEVPDRATHAAPTPAGLQRPTPPLTGVTPPAAVPAAAPRAAHECHREEALCPIGMVKRNDDEALRLVGLVKRYGDFTAVAGIDLSVRRGEVLAFLGSNGAGKSTTIRMATGLLRPTAGRVLVEGRDLWAEGGPVRRLLGYVPDVPLLHESLTAREFLWMMAGLYGLPETEGRRRAEELLAQVGLTRWGDHQIRSFSLGMKRKMAIAAALVHRPRVLLLDEVTNGLDPRAAREVKDFIKAAAREGAAVLLTMHVLEVAEELAHRIAIIHAGQLRAVGDLEALRAKAGLPAAGLEELFLALTADREVGVPA
ncbi:ABC transporter ATP-binding protein [Symbiobacterium terraclitae]|uniref:ABC transporter ATP-binding protein n=1 Tax=Symbiobacterium terraclitae TaxID=557451 RepID=UPI0035B5423A